ncbi:GRIP and coiled-coil domain-containing protein 2-like isoform X2 [Tachysurus fulvidraco]|uniref:GRIP and coiled-coil domain-containing protein 2-like isoform X2 n=1 Tax=Tachysurus fulvidraco TaxID=1234273 RepID=UPI000F515EB0|nr:GRIP and coiled-coil domain-containing protein 2-like isoform X2 [Tachysurus fulvidraco]
MLCFNNLTRFAVWALGAVAVAAGLHFLYKREDKMRRCLKGIENTPVDGDPVQRVSSGFLNFSDGCNYTQLDIATPEAGGKHEKDEVSSVQLNSEEPSEDKECEQERQTFKVLKEMHDDLLNMIKQREEECEQERQAHRLLKENYYRLIKMVKQNKEECEQEQQAHTLLKVKYDEMVKQNEKVLKGTLEHEHGKLKEQVKTLQGSVNRLEGQFYEAQRVCEELLNEQEKRFCNDLLTSSQNSVVSTGITELIKDDLKFNQMHQAHTQQVPLEMLKTEPSGTCCEKSTVSTGITEPSAEDDLKFNSMHQAHTQQVPLETLKPELFGTRFETLNEQMRQQDYNVLWLHYEKTLRSLAEAEEVANTAVASNNELEYMNSILMEKVKMQHEIVKKLERQLCEDQKTRVKLFKSSLVHENARLKEQVKTLQDSVEKLERKLHECHCTHEENLELQKENINVTEELKSMQSSTENLCSISNKDIGHSTK